MEAFRRGRWIAAFSSFARTVSRKLDQLDAAACLRDLAHLGKQPEALKGKRSGIWSIRINDQLRGRFNWPERSNGPTDVEVLDDH